MRYRSFAQLHDEGWAIDPTRGMSTPTYTSIALCLTTMNPRPCVQGYGRTPELAQMDAAHQANTWLARRAKAEPPLHPSAATSTVAEDT